MRAIPDAMDPDVVAGVDRQLRDIERSEQVDLLWVIESGSRAWGFPSPDSDYDCRFIYARPASVYLSPWLPRDVIEREPDPVFDVGGWDLVKAVRLMVKGNATVGEWLRSPIVYRGDDAFRRAFLDLAEEVFDVDRARAHYLHVGRQQWAPDAPKGRLKRSMYALRAAASLHWLRTRDAGVPPMDLPTLVTESDLPVGLVEQVDELIRRKARSRESDLGEVSEEIARFVLGEFDRAEELLADLGERPDPDRARAAATAFFQRWVTRAP